MQYRGLRTRLMPWTVRCRICQARVRAQEKLRYPQTRAEQRKSNPGHQNIILQRPRQRSDSMDFRKEIIKLVKKEMKDIKIDDSALEVPPQPELGDYSLPCFTLAKQMKMSPHDIAQDLVRKLQLKQPIIKIEVKGPYLNFFVNKQKMAESVISDILTEKSRFGKTKKKGKETVMIEFPSPNTNKPLHLGHIRNIVIGDSMAKVFNFLGDKVIRANLNNDRGVHICKSMLAYKRFGRGKKPFQAKKKPDHFVGDFYVRFNQEAKKKPELEEDAKEMLQKWEQGDKEVIKLWKLMNAWAYEGFEETYEALGVYFDKYYYESAFYNKGKDIVLKGLKKGLFKQGEGQSVIAELKQYGLPDKVLLREDGTSIYMTQDIYLAVQKFRDYKLSRSIHVVGNEQNMHFRQLFRILEILGYKWAKENRLVHLSYGMVYLPHGRMKSREGTVVDADDLIEEMQKVAAKEIKKRDRKIKKAELEKRSKIIGLGALKFYFAKTDAAKDMTYDPEESISFEGETGPYVQYTYARICSIIAKYSKRMDAKADFNLLRDRKEEEIVKILYGFHDTVRDSAEHLRPHLMTNYLIRLCQSFNAFYQNVPVLNAEDEKLMKSRLVLLNAVRQVIANGLDLLGIEYVERM
ncbi:arginine--tRNA ligase [Candidatus Woesearchaeota archaeon]|nr:arginine--tRNA ligase [Candidatus Woesearchaeota archaeon]